MATKYDGALTLALVENYLACYDCHPFNDQVPSIAAVARVLSVTRETVKTWMHGTNHPEFTVLMDHLLAEQERVLLNKGLVGGFNSAITKLGLGSHGYSDRQETNVSGAIGVVGQNITEDMDPKEASRLYQEMLSKC